MTLNDIHTVQMTIGLGGLLAGIIAATWGVAWGLNKRFSSVYRRLDEGKERADKKYQTGEMCTVIQQGLNEKIDRIDGSVEEIRLDVKKVLQNGNNK